MSLVVRILFAISIALGMVLNSIYAQVNSEQIFQVCASARDFDKGTCATPPHPYYAPNPEYSEEARQAKFEGTVGLYVIVAKDGTPRVVRVSKKMGMGLDENQSQR